jgi:hypothetical protein
VSGLDSENPITICSDDEEDDVIFGKDENLVFLDDSDEDDDDGDDESEEDETSDEDFKVDELNEASDDDGDVDSYEDEKKKIKRMRMRKYFDVVKELEREVMMDKESGISVNNEEVDYLDYGSVTNSTTIFEKKKGSFDHKCLIKGEEMLREVKDQKSEISKRNTTIFFFSLFLLEIPLFRSFTSLNIPSSSIKQL